MCLTCSIFQGARFVPYSGVGVGPVPCLFRTVNRLGAGLVPYLQGAGLVPNLKKRVLDWFRIEGAGVVPYFQGCSFFFFLVPYFKALGFFSFL